MSELITPEAAEAARRALSLPEQAHAIKVIDGATLQDANEILLTIKDLRKEITATFKPIKQKIDVSKKEVLDQEKKADKPLKQAEALLKPQIVSYVLEQEKKAAEEAGRLRREAELKAEEERLKAAIEAEQRGDKEAAEEILEEEPEFIPPPAIKTAPKLAGTSIRKVWKAQVVDFVALPDEFKEVNESKLGQVARAMKEQCKIPGVRVYCDNIAASGRR